MSVTWNGIGKEDALPPNLDFIVIGVPSTKDKDFHIYGAMFTSNKEALMKELSDIKGNFEDSLGSFS